MVAGSAAAGPVFRTGFAYAKKSLTQWFPGHMAKGLRRMQQLMRSCDCILEIHDARLPMTGRNPKFDHLAGLPRILLLNKADLADASREDEVKAFIERQEPDTSVLHVCADGHQRRQVDQIMSEVVDRLSDKSFRREAPELRLLIAGIPNVGKSTLINAMRQTFAGRGKCAITGDQPGVTRAVQTSIRIHDDPPVYVIDTPGIMLPNVENPDDAMKLAAIGTMKDEVVGVELIADYVLFLLNQMRDFGYVEYFGLPGPSDELHVVLPYVAQRVGALRKGNRYDLDRAARVFIRAFRQGRLGTRVLDTYKMHPRYVAAHAKL